MKNIWTHPLLTKLARTQEISAQDLDRYSDQELLKAYKRCKAWYKMLSVNRAKITMELMNRGILKTYKNYTEP